MGLHLVMTALLGGLSTWIIVSVSAPWQGAAIGSCIATSYFIGMALHD